ncbi:GNAT family N-acetyltransferase [Haloglycomyces albus]|uniref:GNAT family N-acetyltransferase n=1 Tax=Haloglycomyces albus TaxID=526067 RepID=UPI00046D5C84|nr:GNAT family N-acetyltransferase [Haloglycomyces albus]
MITYTTDIASSPTPVAADFFVGWPTAPSQESFLASLKGSHAVVFAVAEDRTIGFINAISDGNLTAFIPWLEVLPEYQGKGIGQELVKRMLDVLGDMYSVDLVCDEDVVPFYEKLNLIRLSGMAVRNEEALPNT